MSLTRPTPTVRALWTRDLVVRHDRTASAIAIVAGAILLVAGLAKFVAHASELAAFRRFGLPLPRAAVVVIGSLEIACGVLLMFRRLVVAAAVVTSVVMVGAITVSGIGQGDLLPSLTLAPALLASVLYLLRRIYRRVGGDQSIKS